MPMRTPTAYVRLICCEPLNIPQVSLKSFSIFDYTPLFAIAQAHPLEIRRRGRLRTRRPEPGQTPLARLPRRHSESPVPSRRLLGAQSATRPPEAAFCGLHIGMRAVLQIFFRKLCAEARIARHCPAVFLRLCWRQSCKEGYNARLLPFSFFADLQRFFRHPGGCRRES